MKKKEKGSEKAIYQPHDKLFKAAFGNPAVTRDFLVNHLPSDVLAVVDLATLEPQKDSFVEPYLRASTSDLVYKVDTKKGPGYLYFLIEHQSTPDKYMCLRLLRYMVSIMEQDATQNSGKAGTNASKLPVVFPFVLYTGKEKYPYPVRLIDAFYSPQLFYTAFEQDFLNGLTDKTNEELKQDGLAALAEFLLREKNKRDFCKILEETPDMAELLYSSKYFLAAFTYILYHESHDPEVIQEKLTKLAPAKQDKIMSALRVLQERGIKLGEQRGIKLGEQRGIRLGEQRGEQKGKAAIITQLLASGMPKAQVAQILGMSIQQLEALLQR